MKQRETLIRKIIPVELFDMAGLEHWLSDMAAQGLHLVKLNHDTARFRRGEPVPGVRFGLEITGVSDIDRERNAAYQEAGWTYVTTLRNLYYVYRTERVDAPPSTPTRRSRASSGTSCTARPAGALSGMCSSLCWRLF